MSTTAARRSVPDRGRAIVFLTGDEGQLIAPARRPHRGGDREKNGGRHDAGGLETGWRRAECGIEPAALAKAKLHLRSYFLRMRRDTCAWPTACVIGSWIAGILVAFSIRTSPVKVGLAGRWYMVIL